jgi:hypothetical protein
MQIWGSQNPRAVVEHTRDSPKINVWHVLMHDQINGPFFFTEETVPQQVCLNMLKLFVAPQVKELLTLIFQQDGAPPHWSSAV